MILRRFTKHVKEQDWFAVGLDMMVVIIGIFVGLQISNWNVERQNVAKGQSYLNRVADELEQDIRYFDATLGMNKERVEDGFFLLETVNDEKLAYDNPTRFISTIVKLGNTYKINVSNNTFEEIKFSGNLDLISDEILRNKIASYYNYIELEQGWGHLRIMVENTYYERMAGILSAGLLNRFSEENDVVFSTEDIQEAYDKFKQKEELIDWIPSVITAKKNSIGFDAGAQRRAKELLEDIRAAKQ